MKIVKSVTQATADLSLALTFQTLKQKLDEEARVNNEIESFLRQHYKVCYKQTFCRNLIRIKLLTAS